MKRRHLFMSYIYKISNDINDKVYIGKTEFSIQKRFQEHCQDSKKRRTEHRPLYNAMNKYGIEHFYVQMIEECDNPEEREQFWIKYYNSYNNGYNATLGGDGKKYLDYSKILNLFDNTKLTQIEIATQCNCSTESVANIVKQYRGKVDWNNRYIHKHLLNQPKKVQCINNGLIFDSCSLAGKWLKETGKVTSAASAKNHIAEVCKGKRKTCGGLMWKELNN